MKGMARRKKNQRREIAKGMVITKETAEIEAARERERQKRLALEMSAVRCGVCGMMAKIVEFGLEGNGVWVGCDRTEECCRYIEIHTEGWSAEECVAEWNRYNSGMFGWLRKMKRKTRGWIENWRSGKTRKGRKAGRLRRFLGKVWEKMPKVFGRTSTKSKKKKGEKK